MVMEWDELLNEPSKVQAVGYAQKPGEEGLWVEGLTRDAPSNNPSHEPDLSDVPMDRRSGFAPPNINVVREPIQQKESEKLAPAARQAASELLQESKGGFDWQRALTRLADGREGVAALDNSRTASARLKLDQGRDKRQADADALSIEDQKRRAELLRAASDPMSEASNSMRGRLITGFEIIGESMPQLKPTLDRFAASVGKMSATDMLAANEQFGDIFKLAGQAAKAKEDREFKEREFASKDADRAEDNKRQRENMGLQYASLAEQRAMRKAIEEQKREDKNQLADEKAIAAYQKEAGPIDANTKTLESVVGSDVKTGWGYDKLQGVRQFLGFEDKDWDSVETALADVENEVRHGLFGASLTPPEKIEFIKALPNMSMPRATLDAKLIAYMQRMADKKKQIAAGHPRAVRALGGETKAPQDPNAAARKWLAENPNDPRAEAVRMKLEGK